MEDHEGAGEPMMNPDKTQNQMFTNRTGPTGRATSAVVGVSEQLEPFKYIITPFSFIPLTP